VEKSKICWRKLHFRCVEYLYWKKNAISIESHENTHPHVQSKSVLQWLVLVLLCHTFFVTGITLFMSVLRAAIQTPRTNNLGKHSYPQLVDVLNRNCYMRLAHVFNFVVIYAASTFLFACFLYGHVLLDPRTGSIFRDHTFYFKWNRR